MTKSFSALCYDFLISLVNSKPAFHFPLLSLVGMAPDQKKLGFHEKAKLKLN